MKTKFHSLFIVLACLAGIHQAAAQGTAFTYQGRLNASGAPASGNFDFQFNLFADAGGTQPVGSAFSTNNLPVSGGLFTTTLDFGAGIFTGGNYFLQISVRTNTGGTGMFTALTPLQPLTPTPYAIMANSASNLLGKLATAQLNGTVGNTQLANNSITVNPGAGLSGGGAVALGGTTTLNNTGVLSVTGGSSDITANTVSGVATLGSDATSAATASTLVKRDGTGSFSAGAITAASFSGNGVALTGLNASQLISIGNNFPATGNFFVGTVGNNGSAGQFNTGVGQNALQAITGGSNDTAYGFNTLHFNFAGSDNTAIGYDALHGNTSGSENTAVGSQALGNSTSGSNNIALGYLAGGNITTGNSNIDIGNIGIATDTNIIRIGSGQTQTYIAGVINGNGSGLAGLNASQLNGVVSTNLLPGFQGPNYSDIGGGQSNLNVGMWSAIGGGESNYVAVEAFDIFGDPLNVSYATVGGGVLNQALNNDATIGGGRGNSAGGPDGAFYATVGGGYENNASGAGSFIGGGGSDGYYYAGGNTASGSLSVIGGGGGNNAGGYFATISGGGINNAGGYYATVGGGEFNNSYADYATVPGGQSNTASGEFSFAAGQQAMATNQGAFVWADSQSPAFASTNNDSFNVRARSGARFVTSGAGVTIDGSSVLTTGNSTLGLSIQTNSSGAPNIVEGSSVNFVSAGVVGATVGGGGATNSGGQTFSNSVSGNFGTVGGGRQNSATFASTVAGGEHNTASGSDSTVGGGQFNTASGLNSTVAGGGGNTAGASAGPTVGGGTGNIAGGGSATIAGGQNNVASGILATISGGGGTFGNTASGEDAVIGGGYGNTNNGNFASIGGGAFNTNLANYATIPGGASNTASGPLSFAAGGNAQAINQGAFVWSDSQGAPFASTNNDSFNVRAQGGIRFFTSSVANPSDGNTVEFVDEGGVVPAMIATNNNGNSGHLRFRNYLEIQPNVAQTAAGGLDVRNTGGIATISLNGGNGNIYGQSVGIVSTAPQGLLEIQGGADNSGANDQKDIALAYHSGGYRHWIRSRHNTAAVDNAIDFFVNNSSSSTASSAPGTGNVLVMTLNGGNVGIGNAEPTHLLVVSSNSSPAYCDGTTWQNGSDRNSKEAFTAVDSGAVLEKVSALPITEWKYKVEADGTKHIGPMAQDFHAAFGLNGGDEKHIATIDEEGVALAAIQGLNQKLEEQKAESNKKDARIGALEKELSELKAAVKKLSGRKE